MSGRPSVGAASVSVVIPTFNRAEMVCRCVRSVLATGCPRLEVVVVDDASPDDTAARLAAQFGGDRRVRVLRNATNSFQAVSRNRGAVAATGDYVLFLDDDNEVAPDVITELLAAFARHPKAGLVAPLAVHQAAGRRDIVWTLGSDFSRWTSQPRDVMPNLPLAQLPPEPIDWPTTYSPNAFMVTREAFVRVGGFEESFVQIFEESDFGWKLMEAGYEGYVAAKARTRHFGFLEPGCVSRLRQLGIERPLRTYCFARNRLRFAHRHFTRLQSLSVALVFAPLSAAWYGAVALRCRRPDIAWAYLRGTVRGILETLVRLPFRAPRKELMLPASLRLRGG